MKPIIILLAKPFLAVNCMHCVYLHVKVNKLTATNRLFNLAKSVLVSSLKPVRLL
jgi:hypothetical protein